LGAVDDARPGLSLASLLLLHDALAADPLGGLLALPVSDTVKQVQGAQAVVARTLSRDDLWLAQTPQMFRYGPLRAALRAS
jgi:2-C-methyl-D-erythritol 4-phosphate cytidylyltransferase